MLGAQLLLARLLGLEAYGVYAYAIAVLNLLVILGKFGLDNVQLRFVAAYRGNREWELLNGLLGWSQRASLTGSLLLAVAGAGAVFLLRGTIAPELRYTLWIAFAAIPFLALSGLRQAALRSLDHIVLAQIPESVLRPALLIGLAGAVGAWTGGTLRPSAAMTLTVVVAVVTFLTGDVWLRGRIPARLAVADRRYARREWRDTAAFLLVVSLLNVLLNWTDVLLIGGVLGAERVGAYAAASRLAVVIQFGLNAFNLVAAPLIAEYHASHRASSLQQVISSSARGMLLYTTVVTGAVFVGGEWVLGLFGSGFAQAYPVLLVLAAGQVGNALTGPANIVMSMTGHQRSLTWMMSIFLVLNVIGTLMLLPLLGPMGAAIATAVSGIGMNIASAAFVWRHLGVSCLALPRGGR